MSNQNLEQLRKEILLKRLQKQMNKQAGQPGTAPIARADRAQALPLSYAQQRLWFLDQLNPAASAAYHLPAGLRLSGRLDRQALRASLERIVARHEILRTTFSSVEGQPVQRIAPCAPFDLVEQDLSALDDGARDAALETICAADAIAPFDLANGPLIRARLLRLAEHEHILLFNQHHIVSDAWSIAVLVRELNALYGAFSANLPDPLAPLALQYADYAAWQRSWMNDALVQTQTEFWRQHLEGAPALLELPTDRPRPAIQSYAGAHLRFALPAALCSGLRALAQRHGATLFMTMLTGWSTLLARMSGQSDVVIGTPVANRQRSEVEPLIGFFVNTLALRVQAGSDLSVEQLLEQVKASTLGAYDHQDLPFDHVVEVVRPVRTMSHSPVFQVMLNLNNVAGQSNLTLAGLEIAPQEQRVVTTQFDLNLSLNDLGDTIDASLTYSSDLFDAASIERLADHFQTLLAAMVANPRQLVGSLPLLNAQQRLQLTAGLNAASPPLRDDLLIHQLFEQRAAARPHAIAAVCAEQQISYGELNMRANQLANYLLALGVQPDDRVAICVERSLDMLVAVLGVLKSGAGYVPLDPAYPADRLAFTLADSAPVALLTQTDLADTVPAGDVPCVLLDGAADAAAIMRQARHNPDPARSGLAAHHLAYVIYTSGSTGMPKGVMVEHRQVTRLLDATDHWFNFNQDDVWTLFHSFAFDFSVWEIWGALLKGGRLVVVPYLTTRSPQEFYELLCDEDVTVLNQTPSAFRQLIAAQGESARQHRLRRVVFGGEALDMAALQPWYERAANDSTLLVNMYGITETTVHVTYRALAKADAYRPGPSPIGRQIPDLQLYILDPNGEPVPFGVTGEMYVGGAGVARGYLNRPELNAERFIADRFSGRPGARLYKTGDLGRWLPDGQVDYLGRNDFQVKIRGFRIELGEIEARLASCAGVREAVVLAREDEPGNKRLVAYLVAHAGIELQPATLRGELAAGLADYMVPSAFVVLDAFPLTGNGKLDRKALPAPDGAAFAADVYQAPSTPLETALCAVWREVLGRAQVGVNDNFFDIGGDSIRSIAIVAKCKEQAIAVAIVDIFKTPTIAALAAMLAERGDAVDIELESAGLREQDREKLPAAVEDAYPLTMLQLGMVFHNESSMDDDSLYHDVATYSLSLPSWNPAALRVVLDAMARKHPILRTSFDLRNYSEPLQLVHREPSIQMTVSDISTLDTAAQDQLIADFVDAERKTAFELGEAPLLRVFIHVRAPALIQYSLSVHHAILDGWSLASFQTELFNEYAKLVDSGADSLTLAPLALSPKLTSARERRALQCTRHRAFWNAQLDDYVFTALPPARLDPAELALPRVKEGRVDDRLCERLQALATELEVPMRTLLLCAHMRLLAVLSGNDDVTTGLVSNVRPEQADGDKVLGLFLNTLPLRQKLGRGSWKDLVRSCYANELEVMAHRDYPYFQLHLDNGRRPYYEVMFNYINFHVYEQLGSDVQVSGYSRGFEATSHALEVDCSFSLTHGIRVEVDARELSGTQVEQIYGYYMAILEAMAANPDQQHSEHCALSPAERAQILSGFNGSASIASSERMIHQMFEDQAAADPGACALVFENQRICYGDLNRRANRLAHHLIALGVKPDDRVAICVERSVEMIVGLLAILKSGGAYVPLDPEYPVDRLAYMLGDSAPVAVLTQAALAPMLPGVGVPIVVLDGAVDATVIGHADSANPDGAALGLHAGHMAYVLYTSGSTGLPKGVMVEHRNVRNLVQHHKQLCGLTKADRVLQFASFGFDNSIAEIFPALATGARIVLRPAHLVVPDQEFIAFLDTHQITMTDLPTAFWHLWASEVRAGRGRPGPSLRVVLAGGEKAERRHLEAWFDAPAMQAVRWINTYGPTEAAVNATTIAYTRDSALPRTDIPIGRPIANTQIYILDKFGQPTPLGVAGEIHIGGVQVARGYLNRAELSAERFVADPFSTAAQARLYKTGDLGRWMDDGSVEYMGRNDFQVKIRGFRIEIGEIEAALAQCPGVRDVVVLAREDNPGDKRLVAYLVAQAGASLDAAALRARLALSLADYMVPSAFVILDSMPLNPNNKLDRKALPAPGQAAVIARTYVAPVGTTETALAQVWKDLLGLEQVGRDDHFFELGGHSLMVVSLIEHLRRLDLPADVRSVFAAPTLAGMAAGIDARAGVARAGAVPANLIPPGCTRITPDMLPLVELSQAEIDGIAARFAEGAAAIEDIYPLAPLQKGILFHHLLEAQGDPYLLRMVLSFDSRQRLDQFLGALQAVIDRHDILRTAVMWTGLREAVQVVCRQAVLPVRQLRLDGEGDALSQLLARIDPRRMRLDLHQAPLFSAHVCEDTAGGGWHLALLHHHLVSDHVTFDFIIAEVRSFIEGTGASLAPSVPYRNFIAHTLAIDPARQDAYFRRLLGDIDQPSAPFGLLDVRGNGERVSEAELALPDTVAARIRASARQHGVTPAVLFHVAWAQVLGQCLGRDDVVFGTVLLGRMQGSEGADQVLGMFMNTLPVRVSLGGASVAEVLARTYSQLSELLEHEQTALTQAQRCSAVVPPLPLFSTLLNYRHSHQPDAAEQEAASQAWEGVRGHVYEERINYPIGMAVTDLGQAFSLSAQCDGVDPERMAAMYAQTIEQLVDALESDARRPVCTLDVLPAAERHQMLAQFNDTAAAMPSHHLIHQLFEVQAARRPDAIALSFDGQDLSYADLNIEANRVAHALLALGVKPNQRVAICVERGPRMLAGLLGIMKAGAGYV
ncbi:MAG: amino acid adenylation domain-containing protein, partial [Pseudomonadota bacterium]